MHVSQHFTCHREMVMTMIFLKIVMTRVGENLIFSGIFCLCCFSGLLLISLSFHSLLFESKHLSMKTYILWSGENGCGPPKKLRVSIGGNQTKSTLCGYLLEAIILSTATTPQKYIEQYKGVHYKEPKCTCVSFN